MLAIRQVLPAALAELRDLDVRGFDIVWQAFTHRYGKASQLLARSVRSSQGRLIAYRQERNEKAEEADARRANKALFRQWDNAADAAERRKLTADVRRYIDSRPRIYTDVSVDMGPCDGWRLLIASERSTSARLAAEAFGLLSNSAADKPIERWGQKDFAGMRQAIDDAFAKLDEAAGLVADLLQLASPANKERIADWAIERKLDFEINLPDGYSWPVTPALDDLRLASANRRHDQQTEIDHSFFQSFADTRRWSVTFDRSVRTEPAGRFSSDEWLRDPSRSRSGLRHPHGRPQRHNRAVCCRSQD